MDPCLLAADLRLGRRAAEAAERLRRPAESAVAPVDHDPAAEDRLTDCLAPDRVRRCFRVARASWGRPAGEPQRALLRAIASPYLERARVEQDRELARRRSELAEPRGGHAEALAREPSPERRERLFGQWLSAEAVLQRTLRAVRDAEDAAAARAGGSSKTALLEAAHPVAGRAWCERFEAQAIAPLDEALARAARVRRGRAGLGGGGAADVAWLDGMGYLAGPASALPVAEALPRAGEALGAELDSGGPAVIGPDAGEPLTRVLHGPGSTCWIALGSRDGLAGLRVALGALGAALRRGFVSARRGSPATRFADPAFEVAASVLYRRLLLQPAFRGACGLVEDRRAIEEIVWREAVAPRRAWSYLDSVLRGLDPNDPVFASSVERATGGPATPTDRCRVAQGDPRDLALLRGTVLGLLIEERLLLRHGRAWYDSRRSRAWLREMWEAEPGRTAEEMAAALDLGTMDATPVVDCCRPPTGD